MKPRRAGIEMDDAGGGLEAQPMMRKERLKYD